MNENQGLFPVLREVSVIEQRCSYADRRQKLYGLLCRTTNEQRFSYADRRQAYQYPITYRYLKNTINGKRIGDFLMQLSEEDWALYAVTEFTELVCDDLINSGMGTKIKYISDKNCSKYKLGYKGFNVVEPDTLIDDYRTKKVQKILVCSVFRQHEIFDWLMAKGVAQDDIVSITGAVFF